MDFLDPRKQRAHMIRLIVGYVLIGVAILISTLILLYQAYGFGLGKDGEVIQNGFVFMSSQPSGSKIYLDGKLYKSQTNTKLQLPEGQYKAELQRDGYDSWQRLITVAGGSVQHFDYPKLFPTKLVTTTVKAYSAAPGFASQSPDRHWLVVQQPGETLDFDVYDLSNPKKVTTAIDTLTVPASVISNAKTPTHAWKLVEWSTDNRHILVQHTSTSADDGSQSTEYIMLDRQSPADSVNLTKTLGLAAGKVLSLRDKKYDQFYVFDAAARTLGTTTVDEAGKVTPLLTEVLAYKSYGADMVLYITDKESSVAKDAATGRDVPVTKPLAAGKVASMLRDGDQTYKIREHTAGGAYLIDMAQYSGSWYIAAGSGADNKVYVYKDPQRIRKASQTAVLVPVQILRVTDANNLAFSTNTEYVMAENGTSFADFDAEYGKGYNFTSKYPLDPPAAHATWMDGQRLAYISGGKLVVFDYDSINGRALVPASADYLPFFDRDYSYVYTLTPSATTAGSMTLTSSSLLTPTDQ